MEVILLERIERLGQMGDVVNVKTGFARNYLLPNKKAMRASKENISYFEKQRAQLEAANLKRRDEAEAVAKKMEGLSVVIVRQASETDQLYGSVSARDVTVAITEAGFTLDRAQVLQERAIKTVGLHQVRIKLHPEVFVTVTANVARSPEEAALQARGERVTPAAGEEAPAGEAPEQPPESEEAAAPAR